MAKQTLGEIATEEDLSPVTLPCNNEVLTETSRLDEKSQELNQVSNLLKDGADGVGHLAVIQTIVGSKEEVDPKTAEMASIAVEAIRIKLGMDRTSPALATESFTGTVKAKFAVDGIMGVVLHILKVIYEVIKSFFLKLKELIFGAKKVVESHKERLVAYRKLADKASESGLLSSAYEGTVPGNLSGFMGRLSQPSLEYSGIAAVLEAQTEVSMAAADALSSMSANGLRYNTAFSRYVEASLDAEKSPLKEAGDLIDLVEGDIKKITTCRYVSEGSGRQSNLSRLFNGTIVTYVNVKDVVNPKDVKSVFGKTKFNMERIQTRALTDLRVANKHELLSLLDTLSTFVNASERLVENTEGALKMSGALEKLTKTTELFLQKDGNYDKRSKEVARDVQAAVGMFAGWITVLGVDLMKLNVHATNAAFGYIEICLRALDKVRD